MLTFYSKGLPSIVSPKNEFFRNIVFHNFSFNKVINTIYMSEAGFGGADEFMGMVNGLKGYYPGIFLAFLPLAFYNRKLEYYKPWFNTLYSLFYPAQFIFLILVRYTQM